MQYRPLLVKRAKGTREGTKSWPRNLELIISFILSMYTKTWVSIQYVQCQ